MRNDSRYFILATTGGGSSLAGPVWGQFDHVMWVTMTQEGPRIANLMLDGIWDENIRTEETTRLVGPLISGRAVRSEPIVVDATHFKGGSASLRLTNDADVPLHVEGSFEAHASLIPSPIDIDRTLAPNSVEIVDVELATSASALIDRLQPLVFQWTASYGGDVKIPAIEGRSRIQVTRLYDVVRRQHPVTIDGQLDEWEGRFAFDVQEPSEIDVDASSWQGADDCSWRFSVEYDDANLYIVVEVTDERQIYRKQHAWVQDGIEIRVDTRQDPERSRGRGDGGFIVVAIGPGDDLDDMVLYPDDLAEQGIQAIGVPTESGHAYEVALPMDLIAAHQGPDWDRIRVNIAVDDYDEESGPLAQLWWQPDWRDGTNFPGSGTFQRHR